MKYSNPILSNDDFITHTDACLTNVEKNAIPFCHTVYVTYAKDPLRSFMLSETE
jgi:hypothetical protein